MIPDPAPIPDRYALIVAQIMEAIRGPRWWEVQEDVEVKS